MTAINQNIGRMQTMIKVFWLIGAMISALLLYWAFEKDPLSVSISDNNPDVFVCVDNSFDFKRYVKIDKKLTVFVEPRLKDLKTNQTYILETKTYETHKQEGVVTFRHKIDTVFPTGLYEYEPHITYRVNPVKIIHKEAPPQTVLFGCNMNGEMLAEVDGIVKDYSIDKATKIYFLDDIMENVR